jgi:N-carbamoylputrescine amidase
MQSLRIALIQVGWLGTPEAMMAQYRGLAAEAAARGAALICLPEFSLIPYFPGTTDPSGFAWAEPLPGGQSEQFFSELARTHRVTLVGSLFEKTPGGGYFDTATIHSPDGALLGSTRKIHIPSGEGYNETTFFAGWHEYPVFDAGPVKLAAPTCYDQWFPELARLYALNGAEFIFYPTAIGSEPTDPAMDTSESWQTVMRGHAIANGVFIGAANRIGVENSVTFYGSSFVCDPTGRVIAQAGRDTVEVVTADLDAHVFEHWRELFPLLRQRRADTYGHLISTPATRSRSSIVGQP